MTDCWKWEHSTELILRLTLPGLKQKRASCALICSSVSTTRDLTLLTLWNVYFESTASTKSGMLSNTLISRKLGEHQSVQMWMKLEYNFEKSENFFTKHSEKQFFNQYCLRSQSWFQHHIHPRAIMDNSQIHSEFNKFQRHLFIRGF